VLVGCQGVRPRSMTILGEAGVILTRRRNSLATQRM
jgi:hypothetical protein